MRSGLVERREVKQKRLQVENTKEQLVNLPPRKVSEIESQVVIKVRISKAGIAWKCIQLQLDP